MLRVLAVLRQVGRAPSALAAFLCFVSSGWLWVMALGPFGFGLPGRGAPRGSRPEI